MIVISIHTNETHSRTRRTLLLCAILATSSTASVSVSPPIRAGEPTTARPAGPTRLPKVDQSVAPPTASAQVAAPITDPTPLPPTPGLQAPAAEVTTPVSYASSSGRPQLTERNWLPSGTSSSTSQVAANTLARAHQEFLVGAWLSSETSAWDAIRWAAESIDQHNREIGRTPNQTGRAPAITTLQVAKQAIREARDFGTTNESLDPHSIARLARSHQTNLLQDESYHVPSGTDASDRYLDFARIRLATVASRSVEAAQAMDLLAAIYLRRADPKTLPSATALCLRRAALQGQPNNASLATNLGIHLMQVGLNREAQWALSHSMTIDPQPRTAQALATILRQSGNPSQANALIASVQRQNHENHGGGQIQVPEITRLSPEEFASLSKSVVWNDPPARTIDPNSVAQPSSNPEQDPGQVQVKAKIASARVANPSVVNASVVNSGGVNSGGAVPIGDSKATVPIAPILSQATVPETKQSPLDRLKLSWKRLTNRSD